LDRVPSRKLSQLQRECIGKHALSQASRPGAAGISNPETNVLQIGAGLNRQAG
jgi:hypothetical protein